MEGIDLNGGRYRDQVLGCWLGKNVGGTLGAPLEKAFGEEEPFDVDWYPRVKEGGAPSRRATTGSFMFNGEWLGERLDPPYFRPGYICDHWSASAREGWNETLVAEPFSLNAPGGVFIQEAADHSLIGSMVNLRLPLEILDAGAA